MIAYLLSSVKLVFTVLLIIILVYLPTHINYAVIAIILIVVFDIADGYIARLLQIDNNGRRLFDSITDVLITHIGYLTILWFLQWSLWWYVPLLIRDGLLTLWGAFALKHAKTVVFPTIFHKIARGSLALASISMLWQWYGEYCLIIAYCLIVIASIDYYGSLRTMPKNKSKIPDWQEFHPKNFAGINNLIKYNRLLEPKKDKHPIN